MADYLHVIKTNFFIHDSRLIKWVDSLKANGIDSEVFILQDDNKPGVWDRDGCKVTNTHLFTRKIFKQRKGYLVKAPEYAYKTLRYLRKSEAKTVVFHDLQNYLSLYILCLLRYKKKRIVLDLHELPHNIMGRTAITRSIMQCILNNVDFLVYSNSERREYTLNKYKYKEKGYAVLNNYTDEAYINQSKAELPEPLKQWLNGDRYILWLGAAAHHRNFMPVLEALRNFNYKLVILGRLDSEAAEYVKEHNMKHLIYSTFVPENEMIQYIDNALFSIVLYKNNSPNNYYCEPNRLYQLTTRKIPVITGNNPPLMNFVNQFNAGVVLPDDGSSASSIVSAIEKMHEHREAYVESLNDVDFTDKLSWNKQFKGVLERLKN